MRVGEVRVAEDQDFGLLKIYLTRNDGWELEYEKRSKISVWTRPREENNNFKMVRLKAIFNGVQASTLYDVLQDPAYKKYWDKHTMEVQEIGHINPNNTIGYYSSKWCYVQVLFTVSSRPFKVNNANAFTYKIVTLKRAIFGYVY